jgi:hypothetical protein
VLAVCDCEARFSSGSTPGDVADGFVELLFLMDGVEVFFLLLMPLSEQAASASDTTAASVELRILDQTDFFI